MYKYLFLFLLLIILAGCANKKFDKTKDWSADRIYAEAKSALERTDFELAAQYYETLKARYPFSSYAKQAELETAYAYYKYDNMDSALVTIERYIREHPNGPGLDYALYLKGLIHGEQLGGPLNVIFPKNPAEYDNSLMQSAFISFNELVQRFPNSMYAEDSKKRLVFLRNKLAEHELQVADYYYRRGAYIAVINRCQYLLEEYQGAPSMPEALVLMVKAYRKLDVHDLAEDTLRILQLNYPTHPALEKL